MVQQKSRPCGRLVREHTKLFLAAEEQQGSRTQTAKRERGRFRNNTNNTNREGLQRGEVLDRARISAGGQRDGNKTRNTRVITISQRLGVAGGHAVTARTRATPPNRNSNFNGDIQRISKANISTVKVAGEVGLIGISNASSEEDRIATSDGEIRQLGELGCRSCAPIKRGGIPRTDEEAASTFSGTSVV